MTYTITNERITIQEFEEGDEPALVKTYENSLTGISLLHISGILRKRMRSVFIAAPLSGVILSVQFISQNSRFEFESFNSISVNFAPVIECVQLMRTNISFRHGYERPGSLNRLDIYMPATKADEIIPDEICEKLYKQQILNLQLSSRFSYTVKESVVKLAKELEKPVSKTSPLFLEKFIGSMIP